MIIQICLDPIGNFNVNSTVNIYTNSNDFTNPLVTDIPVSDLVYPNCPFEVDVPDVATVVKIFDINNNNCVYIPISGQLCEECLFTFDVTPQANGSVLTCGNLINNDCISDGWELHYRIEWINESNETIITTGYGSDSFTFDYQHPLTGNNSVPMPPGTYTPILTHVWLNWSDPTFENGIVYNGISGYTGIMPDAPIYLMPTNTCLDYTVTIEGLTCDVSYNPFYPYTHSITFEGYSNSQPPFQTNFAFILNNDIKYIAILYRGYNEPDTFKVTLHAAAYSDPIILEWLTVGSYISPCDIDYYGYPKKYRQGLYRKITKLEHYTIIDGDYIELEVTSESPYTKWSMSFKCITEELNCDSCIFYPENHRRIFAQSINTTNTPRVCNSNDITTEVIYDDAFLLIDYSMESCHDFSGTTSANDNDFFKYLGNQYTNAGFFYSVNDDSGLQTGLNIWSQNTYNNITNFIHYPNYPLYNAFPNISIGLWSYSQPCYSTEYESLITYSKPANQDLVIHLQDQTLFDMLVESLSFMLNEMSTYSSQDPTTSIEYYTIYDLRLPHNTNGENWGCGDGVSWDTVKIHCSSEITWGDLDENTKFINITLPQITNQLPYDSDIDPCLAKWSTANNFINSLQGSNNQIIYKTNNYSLCYTNIFAFKNLPFEPPSVNWHSAPPSTLQLLFHKSLLETIPLNSSTLEEIPELSATTCENLLTVLPQYYSDNFPFGYCDNAQYNDDFYGFSWTYFRGEYIGDDDPTTPLHEWAIKEVYTNQYVISGNSNTGEYTIINPNYVIE